MEYNVIKLEITEPSFKHSSGKYIVVEKNENSMKICPLENNKPCLFSNGKFMTLCLSSKSPWIKETNDKITFNG